MSTQHDQLANLLNPTTTSPVMCTVKPFPIRAFAAAVKWRTDLRS